MIRINLHTHSTCSDGAFSPSELVRLLSLNKVAVAALTDHDTVLGVPAFLAGCRRRGIRAVSGVELSSRFENGDELHILGYRFNLEAPALTRALDGFIRTREARNVAICSRLQGLGVPVTLADAEARAGGGAVGRPHIARALVDRGCVPTVQEAFARYLGEGGVAFVPRELISSQEAVRLILEAGGLPVWAHPLASLSDPDALGPVMDRLKGCGLWGVECWSRGSSSADALRCMMEAGYRGLYRTAGTDFHGRAGDATGVAGRLVEDDFLPWARFCGGR